MLTEYSSFFNSGLRASHAEEEYSRSRRMSARSAPKTSRASDTVTPAPRRAKSQPAGVVSDLLAQFPDVPAAPRRPRICVDTSAGGDPASAPALKSSALLSSDATQRSFVYPPARRQAAWPSARAGRASLLPAGPSLKRPRSAGELPGEKRSRRRASVLLPERPSTGRGLPAGCPDQKLAHDAHSFRSSATTKTLAAFWSSPARSLRNSYSQVSAGAKGWIH
ncbi:hypothetical protein PsYK624_093430 [Phanerochaete sordida]|uniref:Uncharacterized protein n=1 Tax=Phanerochaete sordida TaxID=48140 RepID=A0A9P3GGE0_9APHY|nr:hypothetical protein PsYK624_093430 [Phanerochaete sordida]